MNIKILLPTLALFVGFQALAQTDGVLIDYSGTTRDNSAVLDVRSTTQGVLLPRVTTAQRTAISSPADGLLVYDSDLNEYYRYDTASGSWKVIASGNTGFVQNQYSSQQSSTEYWISGRGRMDGGLTVGAGGTIDNNNINTGTVAAGALAFGNASGEGIGSKRSAGGNQYGLDFYTQSSNRLAITNLGNVGIATTAPSAKLHVNGDVLLENALRIDNGNGNTGTVANSITFGNSSGEGIGSKRNAGGNQYGLDFYTNSVNRMAITQAGNVGIGTSGPTAQLTLADVGAAGYKNLLVGDDTYFTDVDVTDFLGLYSNVNTDRAGLRLGSDGSYLFGDGGFMGLGTTSPSATLHVIHHTSNTSPTSPSGNWSAIIENRQDDASSRNGLAVVTRWGSNASKVFEAASYWTGGSQAYTPILTVTGDRRVGIGTTTPNSKLQVSGVGDGGTHAYAYLNSGGSTGTCGSCGADYSIWADGRIRGSEFNAMSDNRIKNVIEITDTKELLNQVNQLEVTKYSYIDQVEHGTADKQGFIAQQVEKVIPAAIRISDDFIPNIFASASVFEFDPTSGICIITTKAANELSIEDEVKLILENGAVEVSVLEVIDPTTFSCTLESAPSEIFVFGKKVNDFRAVDYDQLFSIGIGAIQELSKENQQLKSEVESLKAQLQNMGDLKAEIESIKGYLNLDVYGSTTE